MCISTPDEELGPGKPQNDGSDLVVALGVARKLSLFDFFLIPSQGLQGIGFQMGVGLHEFRDEGIKESQ